MARDPGPVPVPQCMAAAIAALACMAAAVWRGVVAWQHFVAARAIVDDPSMRELEEVSALLESGAALLLAAHAIVLAVATRRRFAFPLPHALAVATVCALALAGTLARVPILDLPGAYPVTVVIGAAIVSLRLRSGWVSAYAGAAAGSVLAWYLLTPVPDAFVGLAVTVPCVFFALVGTALGRGVMRSRSGHA